MAPRYRPHQPGLNIRRNSNVRCSAKIGPRPTSRRHAGCAPSPNSDGGLDLAIDLDRPRSSAKDPYSHSIVAGGLPEMS